LIGLATSYVHVCLISLATNKPISSSAFLVSKEKLVTNANLYPPIMFYFLAHWFFSIAILSRARKIPKTWWFIWKV